MGALAALSASGPGVTRLPFTPQHRAAVGLLWRWMRAAGLDVALDDAGTLVGRCRGAGPGTFYLGSHQDTVPEGGAYDGIMGVVLPILALEKLRADGVTLPFAVEILAFADEEGVRFPTALIGSRALAGRHDPAVLDMADAQGVTLGAALRGFGLDPGRIPLIGRDGGAALGFLETHIEQGPAGGGSGLALPPARRMTPWRWRIFARCRGGVSHSQAEFSATADLGRAVVGIAGFLAALSPDATRP